MNRRSFLRHSAAAALGPAARRKGRAAQSPNIVLIVADDLGYGDLGAYGSHIPTPNLDRMAREGVLFRQFYSASPVCSASRAAILTGRYGVRCGVPGVFQPDDPGGMAESETTLAQMARQAGYRTMCIGKWHLGRPVKYLPTSRGFDAYYGIPYSNDMEPSVLMRNTGVVESPVNLASLTKRYTEEAVHFIRQYSDTPFFLYFPHTSPHIPLAVSSDFAGKSSQGLYGDVVQELDWSAGQVFKALEESGVDQNTLVMFTSDNGPWFQGSPGRLRGRKGDTFEGGMREPFLARLPGRIPAGKVVEGFATTLDILPTITALTQWPRPANPLDGVDIGPMLTGEAEAVDRPVFLYFSGWNLQCARLGRWKLHMARYNTPAFTPEPKVGLYNLRLTNPELYDMDTDPEEAEDTSGQNPEIVTDIQRRVAQILPGLPNAVQTAWHDTQTRRVNPNEPGAWPTPIL
jgi:arylsulfatase